MNRIEQPTAKRRAVNITIAAFAIILVFLNITRILNVPVTFDEVDFLENTSATYSDFIHLTNVTANTHILNSILRKFFTATFSDNQFFLRLPSLLAQIVYLFASYAVCKKIFKNGYWLVGTFLCLNLNPFLFDFWGLSRGYALAIAFMMLAIYYLINYLQEQRVRHISFCLLCCLASIYSNFSLINFSLAVAGVLTLQTLLRSKTTSRKFSSIILPMLLLFAGVTYAMVHEPIEKLRAEGQLYYGGDTGIIKDTLFTVINESMFINKAAYIVALYISYILAGSFAIAGLYWLTQLLKNLKNRKDSDVVVGVSVWLLFAILLAALEIQHRLLGTKYLIDRTALFLLVCYMLQLCYWLYYLHYKRQHICNIAFAFICVLVSINFITNINLSSTWQWAYDKNSITVLDRMMEESSCKKDKIKLAVSGLFFPSLNYYVARNYKEQFEQPMVIRPFPDTTVDYYYVSKGDLAELPHNYKPDTAFEIGGTKSYKGVYTLMKKQCPLPAKQDTQTTTLGQ